MGENVMWFCYEKSALGDWCPVIYRLNKPKPNSDFSKGSLRSRPIDLKGTYRQPRDVPSIEQLKGIYPPPEKKDSK